MTKGSNNMQFQALEVSISLIESLKQPLASIRSRDPGLYRQIRAAASSIALNLAEGNRRQGLDRIHHFRIAAGSADEVRTGLRIAVAWGDSDGEAFQTPMQYLDRILAMLWRLTH